MLVLARRVSQAFKIGPDITVVVVGVNGKQVRIGIAAPKDVTIHREEILDKIRRDDEATRALLAYYTSRAGNGSQGHE
jgi:carbon storage regulator